MRLMNEDLDHHIVFNVLAFREDYTTSGNHQPILIPATPTLSSSVSPGCITLNRSTIYPSTIYGNTLHQTILALTREVYVCKILFEKKGLDIDRLLRFYRHAYCLMTDLRKLHLWKSMQKFWSLIDSIVIPKQIDPLVNHILDAYQLLIQTSMDDQLCFSLLHRHVDHVLYVFRHITGHTVETHLLFAMVMANIGIATPASETSCNYQQFSTCIERQLENQQHKSLAALFISSKPTHFENCYDSLCHIATNPDLTNLSLLKMYRCFFINLMFRRYKFYAHNNDLPMYSNLLNDSVNLEKGLLPNVPLLSPMSIFESISIRLIVISQCPSLLFRLRTLENLQRVVHDTKPDAQVLLEMWMGHITALTFIEMAMQVRVSAPFTRSIREEYLDKADVWVNFAKERKPYDCPLFKCYNMGIHIILSRLRFNSTIMNQVLSDGSLQSLQRLLNFDPTRKDVPYTTEHIQFLACVENIQHHFKEEVCSSKNPSSGKRQIVHILSKQIENIAESQKHHLRVICDESNNFYMIDHPKILNTKTWQMDLMIMA